MNIIARLRASKTALRIGIFLLIINPPLGHFGFVMGGYLSSQYSDVSYLIAAAVFYAFTWVMAGAGIILAGPRGVELAKNYLKKILRKN